MNRRLSEPVRTATLRGLEPLVLKRGFVAVTADELAAWLGCSKSTLYRLGPSKEQIAVAVLRGFLSRTLADADRLSARESSVDGRLRVYVTQIGRAHAAVSITCLRDVLDRPAARAVYQSTIDTVRLRVGELVELGMAAGAFRPVSAAFVAEVAALVLDHRRMADFLLDSIAA